MGMGSNCFYEKSINRQQKAYHQYSKGSRYGSVGKKKSISDEKPSKKSKSNLCVVGLVDRVCGRAKDERGYFMLG